MDYLWDRAKYPKHLVLETTISGSGDFRGSAACWDLVCTVLAPPLVLADSLYRESPRWYVQKNKPERALKILAHYFAFDDEQDITVQFVHREIETTLALEKEFSKYSIFEFFKTKGNRHRLFILVTMGFFSQWSGNAIISYYLTKVLDQVGITDQKEQLEINGGLGLWGWIVAVSCSLMIDKFGRRKMFLLSTFSMMLVYVPLLNRDFLINVVCNDRLRSSIR